MKNSVMILMFVCSAILCVSCEDLLEAPAKSTLDESAIFSSPSFAVDAIPGVLNMFSQGGAHSGRFLPWYGVNNDVEIRNGLSSVSLSETDDLTYYHTSPLNSQMNLISGDTYTHMFTGIERANLAIRGLRTYADLSNWELAQILGEMLTLRAICYAELLKAFGNVPERFDPVNSETVYLPRADRDVILKQLLADLEEAAELVGWPNENTYTKNRHRISKSFVKAMRARLALWAGGYSLHAGEAVMRMSNDPDLARDKMYAIAKQECLDVINSGYIPFATATRIPDQF